MALFAAADYSAARALAEPFAESGIADAQCMMGLLFQLGAGTDRNGEQAGTKRRFARGTLWHLTT